MLKKLEVLFELGLYLLLLILFIIFMSKIIGLVVTDRWILDLIRIVLAVIFMILDNKYFGFLDIVLDDLIELINMKES